MSTGDGPIVGIPTEQEAYDHQYAPGSKLYLTLFYFPLAYVLMILGASPTISVAHTL